MITGLPPAAVGLRLHRIDARERLIACEVMRFDRGYAGVELVLRRALISGRVEVGGEILNHFADVLADNGDIIETVALDAGSYRALKTHWMRCKVEHPATPSPHSGVAGLFGGRL